MILLNAAENKPLVYFPKTQLSAENWGYFNRHRLLKNSFNFSLVGLILGKVLQNGNADIRT
ncbi:MAG: hypothetical protein Fur006_21000 [Coleofasciculaceae cyanobacterium]